MFTREALLASEWYAERLDLKQQKDIALWTRHVSNMEKFLANTSHAEEANRLAFPDRLARAKSELERIKSPAYREGLVGFLGCHPM